MIGSALKSELAVVFVVVVPGRCVGGVVADGDVGAGGMDAVAVERLDAATGAAAAGTERLLLNIPARIVKSVRSTVPS